MKNWLVVSLFIFSGVPFIFAQIEKKQAAYAVMRNDRESLPKLGIVGYPFMIQSGGYGSMAICYGAELNYNIIPNFTIFGKGFLGYGTGTVSDTKDAIDLQPFH